MFFLFAENFTILLSVVDPNIPADFVAIGDFGHFKYHHQQRWYKNAQADCESQSARIVWLESPEKWTAIWDYIMSLRKLFVNG